MKALEARVSLYDNIKNTTNGQSVELGQVLKAIKDGKWKNQIAELRAESNPQKQALLKKHLSNFTASGLFESRKKEGLVQHSDIIVLDFDGLEDVQSVQKRISTDPHLNFSFVSCRGNGLAVGVVIDGKRHRESFQGLEEYFLSNYELQVDQSCKDVSRTRFISDDPDMIIQPTSKVFELPNPEIETPSSKVEASDEEKYEWCKSIVDKRRSYASGNHHSYLFSLGGFANKVGVDEAYAISSMISDFEVSTKKAFEIRSIVEHCYKHTSDFGTIKYTGKQIELPKSKDNEDVTAIYRYVHKLNREGTDWTSKDVVYQSEKFKLSEEIVRGIFQFVFDTNKDEFGIKNKPVIKQVEVFLNKNFTFRKNVITQQFEYRKNEDKEFLPMDPDSIYRSLKHANISYPLNQLISLLQSDFIEDHNPFIEKFLSLPKWDGKTDHIGELANYVVATRQSFFQQQLKKTLVRCIACSLYGIVNRIVFVLVSEKQEIGKSSFIRFLNPFDTKYYTESPLRDNKDSEFRLVENMIYNLEELSSLNSLEVNSLKAIISKAVIKERRPYARYEVEAPRRCNFFGSTNKEEFLTDVSNTRWLCFTIDDIDWEYSKKVNMDQVWAQAFALYHQGFYYQLTREEREIREEVNRSHEVRSNESDLITKYFTVIKKTDKYAEFMSLVDIEDYIQNQTQRPLKMHRMALGRAMTQLGFVKDRRKENGTQVRGYWVGIAARGSEEKPDTPNAII
tara:strand:+ start:48103 stop:50307 length:2205 start_codon:yes stop_codon:yes gene_type:complete